MTSQVVNTTGSQSGNSLENIGTTYEHDAYTPILKKGSSEQGLVKLTPKTLSQSKLESLYSQLVTNINGQSSFDSYSKVKELNNKLGSKINIEPVVKELVCFYYNYINNRFINLKEFNTAKESISTNISDLSRKVSESAENSNNIDSATAEQATNELSLWGNWVSGINLNN